MTRPVVPVERAGAADLALLAMESGGVPEHLGAVLVLGADLDVESARRVLTERIRGVPRLRQRLVRSPFGCGRPVWVDDPGFDATRHVRIRRCPDPGDEQALLDVAAAVIAEPLPRSRPLWAAVLVTGPVGGRVGLVLVLVLHHVLADGVDGLAILARLLDGAVPGPARTFPQPCPPRHRLAADAFRSRLRSLGRLRADGRTLRASMPSGPPVPRAVACSILHVTGTRRRFAVARTGLVALHAAGRRHGGTVNDALLAAVGGALHALLDGRGEHVATFRVAVMVADRRVASADAPGNRAVPLIVDVPGTGTPAERLERIAGTVRAARAPATGGAPPVPPTLLRLLAAVGLYRLYLRHQHRLHTLVSNVPGPDRPLTLDGVPVTAIIPIGIAEAGNLTVTVVALSYAGTFTVTVSADPDQVPDLPVLAAALQAELDALAAAPGPEPDGHAAGRGPLQTGPTAAATGRGAVVASDAPTQGGRLPMRSRDVMTTNVVTVTPATTVKDAADLMAARGFTALPVLDAGGDLIGLVTEADVVRGRFPRDARYLCTDEAGAARLDDPPREPAVTVGAVMTSPATVMTGGSDVVDLVTAMETAGIRSMPIVDGTRLVGIVTRRDLVRTLARADASIATDVRHRLEIYGGPGRWTVDVSGGAVTIRDAFDSDTDRHVATVLAEAVPGVAVVHVEGPDVQ